MYSGLSGERSPAFSIRSGDSPRIDKSGKKGAAGRTGDGFSGVAVQSARFFMAAKILDAIRMLLESLVVEPQPLLNFILHSVGTIQPALGFGQPKGWCSEQH